MLLGLLQKVVIVTLSSNPRSALCATLTQFTLVSMSCASMLQHAEFAPHCTSPPWSRCCCSAASCCIAAAAEPAAAIVAMNAFMLSAAAATGCFSVGDAPLALRGLAADSIGELPFEEGKAGGGGGGVFPLVPTQLKM